MATWKDLFGSEICKCGKKGEYLKMNGSGKITGWRCNECHKKEVEKLVVKIDSSRYS